MREAMNNFFDTYLGEWYIPDVRIIDVIEIIIICVFSVPVNGMD